MRLFIKSPAFTTSPKSLRGLDKKTVIKINKKPLLIQERLFVSQQRPKPTAYYLQLDNGSGFGGGLHAGGFATFHAA